jgi:hypothetical protein
MSNVIKFQSPFERLKLFQNSPDVSLHKAIITQAIIDASNISDNKKAVKLEREAKNWIFGCGEYFKTICMEACIEPQLVIKITKQIIQLHKDKVKIKSTTRKSPKPVKFILKKRAEKGM